jgi:hypothetical protein
MHRSDIAPESASGDDKRMSGYLQRRRRRKRIEKIKRDVSPNIAMGEETAEAQMLVSTAAFEVGSGHVRSDGELREDFACQGDMDRVAGLLRAHQVALLFLVTRYPSDPMTPMVEVQLERKIATLRQLMSEAGT